MAAWNTENNSPDTIPSSVNFQVLQITTADTNGPALPQSRQNPCGNRILPSNLGGSSTSAFCEALSCSGVCVPITIRHAFLHVCSSYYWNPSFQDEKPGGHLVLSGFQAGRLTWALTESAGCPHRRWVMAMPSSSYLQIGKGTVITHPHLGGQHGDPVFGN